MLIENSSFKIEKTSKTFTTIFKKNGLGPMARFFFKKWAWAHGQTF
jgi:hypothetical protein